MIRSEDINYQDNRITILKKECNKGVIIGSYMTNPRFFQFNVPFYVCNINYSSPRREIISLYGWSWLFQKKKLYIRVDPEKTYIDESNIKLSDYMKNRELTPLFLQILYNDSRKYHIGVRANYLNRFNIVDYSSSSSSSSS